MLFQVQLRQILQKSPFVDNCILYGDNKPFNICVVDPNKDEIIEWAKTENIDFSQYEDLLAKPELKQKIERDIKKVCNDILSHEKPRKIILSREAWSVENGYITPSMKPRRHMVLNTYENEIASIYNPNSKLIWETIPQVAATAV